MPTETYTELYPGQGGSKMDERLVPNSTAGAGGAHRAVVVPGSDTGAVQSFVTESGVVKAQVNDVNVLQALVMLLTAVETPTAVLSNGEETPVSTVEVEILAANPDRKSAIVQNSGQVNIRVGVSGVTPTTGMKLGPGDTVIYEGVQQALFAISESSVDSVAFAQETTA